MGKAWGPTTTRVTRHPIADTTSGDKSSKDAPPFPPRAPVAREHVIEPAPSVGLLPQPLGDLSCASAVELVEVLSGQLPGSQSTKARRRAAIGGMAAHLSTWPGHTWQQRWDASPWGAPDATLASGRADGTTWWSYATGFKWLAAARVIVPSVRMLRSDAPADYADIFRAVQHDVDLDDVLARLGAAAGRASLRHHRDVRNALVFALSSQGVALRDLTPAGLLFYAEQLRQVLREPPKALAGTLIWEVLVDRGTFPGGTPPTMRLAQRGGQRTVTELVDAYQVGNVAVRQLLIDYIGHRVVAGMDYTTATTVARNLVRNFWCAVERLNPGQADLKLDEATYTAWRAQLDVVRDKNGAERKRQGVWDVLIAVRAFYLDLHSWAADDPARWATWVAPCPVPAVATRAYRASRRRLSERMADRTRVRQPLLDLLVEFVRQCRDHLNHLQEVTLAIATGSPRPTQPVETTVDGVDYVVLPAGPRVDASGWRVRVAATGEVLVPVRAAERAFWAWAVVEILRLTGIRQEELLELSQTSIRRYQRPNGETVALLIIAPSKTDRERVIPMSGELLHVLAELIRFHTRDGRPIPLVRRWDPYERQHSAPLPYLFQPSNGPLPAVGSPTWIRTLLIEASARAASAHPELAGVVFTSHDFRRIFATELINNGLPIHIGAALLGHADLQTTRGYVAVFDDDVVHHYQQFLDRRRTLRPEEEYPPATEQEWDEFEQHFDKRKVELGTCARPYGTPCVHEHACIRCPMLNLDAAMLHRLDELEADLVARRDDAHHRGWLGETDGIDITLDHLRRQRDRARKLKSRPVVQLGMPSLGAEATSPGSST